MDATISMANAENSRQYLTGLSEDSENWRQFLTELEQSGLQSNNQAEFVNPQVHVEVEKSVASAPKKRRAENSVSSTAKKRRAKKSDAFTAKKRKGCKTTRTSEERYRVKIEYNRNRRKNISVKLQRLMKVANVFGGIDELESFVFGQDNDQKKPEYEQFKQVKFKHGGLEEIESKLNKLKQLEAEAPLFEKVKTMFGGIQNIEPGLEKLKKKTEFQQILKSTQQEMEFNSTQNEKEIIDFPPESSEFLQQFGSVVNKKPQPHQLGMENGEQTGIRQSSYTALLLQGEGDHPNYQQEGDHPNMLPRLVNSHYQQYLNFQRDAEEGVGCSEQNRINLEAANGRILIPSLTPEDKAKNQLDQAGASAEGYIERIRRVLTEEQDKQENLKKREICTKYKKIKIKLNELRRQRGIKPQYDRLMKIASSFWEIDEMEKQIHLLGSHEMMSPLNSRLQEEDIAHDMFWKENKTEFTQFGQIMSKLCGGIQEIKSILDKLIKEVETETNRLEVMKFKEVGDEFRDIQETESILDKLKQWEAELRKFDSILNELKQLEAEAPLFEKVMNMFGGIQNIEPGSEKLKKRTEFQQILESTQQEMELNSAQKGKELIDFLPESPEFLQEQMHSVNSNNQGSVGDSSDLLAGYEVSQILFLGLDAVYSDKDVSDFIRNLDNKEAKSNVNVSSFKGLDAERQRVGDYNFPISLVSTAKAIMDARGDIAKHCLINPNFVENTYVLLCAAMKEMGDFSLKQVNADIMLKWRDAIMDAKRVGFDVEFALEHLKKVGYAYYGFKAGDYRNTLQHRKKNLRDERGRLRLQLKKNAGEMYSVKIKEKELSSEQCKMCQDYADYFKDRNVGLFLDN